MNKELSDRVWKILPKEFKEEVKYEYNKTKTKKIKKECDLGFLNAHEGMFGLHNLTSDAEGEDMLIVESSLVKEYYKKAKEVKKEALHIYSQRVADKYHGICEAIEMLFGSKCLPDEVKPTESGRFEPKPAEPKEEADKHFDTILRDGFRNERRLNIAVQLTCAMIPKYQDNGDGHGLSVLNEKDMIKCAYRLADTLIAKCEKKGEN